MQWTLVSDSILSVHRRLCSGVTLRHAANDETSERYADSYVDDTDVYAGHDGPETYPEITDDMDPRTEEDEEVQMTVFNLQKASQAMTNLINYLGHSMAFHKCLWQLSAWKQKDGRAVQREHEESHGEIILEDHNGVKSKIKRMKHTEPNEGLGFLIAPTGNQEPEYTKRLKQARECMARILPVQLTLREAWLALVTRVLPKVTYPFKLTRFTKKQLKRLSIVIDNVMLPKMGINRKMKRAVIYAPLELGGIGYPSIETIQDQQSIGHFVRHLQWGKEIATDLKIALSHAQLQSGMVTPILDDTSFLDSARVVLDDPDVDVGVVGCVPLTPALRTLEDEDSDLEGEGGVLAGLLALWADSVKAWVAVVDGGPSYDALARGLAEGGTPTFRRSDRALRALARFVRWRLD